MFEMISQWDGTILHWIQSHLVVSQLTPFVRTITFLGNGAIVWIIICLVLCIHKKTRKAGFLALVSMLVTFLIVNVVIKNAVARIRPYDAYATISNLIGVQSDYSFPSGHSASSFAAAIVLFLQLPKKYSTYFLILAICISLSRLYVGVHYPSDVILGALLGLGIALLVIFTSQRIEKSRSGGEDGAK